MSMNTLEVAVNK